jgi:hypothetical protein
MAIVSVTLGRQIEIHTPEILVPGPYHLEIEIPIAKLKRYKSADNDQISEEIIQARGQIILSEIQKLIKSVRIKEELPDR